MSEELKPCPFCGGKAIYYDLGSPDEFVDWGVKCIECCITVICPGEEPGCIATKDEAIKAWNRRASE